MALFTDITALQESIQKNRSLLEMRGISLGRVCFIDSEKRVKVKDINAKAQYVTNWIKPSATINQVHIGDYVFYTYPDMNLINGIYFLIAISEYPQYSGGLTEDQVNTLIQTALTTYDQQIRQWSSTEFVTKTAYTQQINTINQNISTTDQNLATTNQNLTATNQEIVIIQKRTFEQSRYTIQSNAFTQGGDYALTQSWINRCVTFIVNDVNYPSTLPPSGYYPSPIDPTIPPTAVEYKNASFVDTKYRLIGNSGSMNNMPRIGDSVYIRNASRFKMYVRGDLGSYTVNGSASIEFLISPLSQWKLSKSGSTAFTLVDVGYNFLPY